MKADLKKGLLEAFEAPAPTQKNEFLKTIRHSEISNFSFILSQIGYIPLYVWGMSGATFGIALAGGYFLEKDVLWIISALIPFIALSLLTGNVRSDLYMMSELEMAARFSLKSVVLARLGILGISHLFLLLILTPVCAFYSTASVFQTGLYLLSPYMLTAFAGLWVSRKIHWAESVYMFMGIAVGISGINTFIRHIFPVIYESECTAGWSIGLIILMILVIKELKINIRQTEELTWNFT